MMRRSTIASLSIFFASNLGVRVIVDRELIATQNFTSKGHGPVTLPLHEFPVQEGQNGTVVRVYSERTCCCKMFPDDVERWMWTELASIQNRKEILQSDDPVEEANAEFDRQFGIHCQATDPTANWKFRGHLMVTKMDSKTSVAGASSSRSSVAEIRFRCCRYKEKACFSRSGGSRKEEDASYCDGYEWRVRKYHYAPVLVREGESSVWTYSGGSLPLRELTEKKGLANVLVDVAKRFTFDIKHFVALMKNPKSLKRGFQRAFITCRNSIQLIQKEASKIASEAAKHPKLKTALRLLAGSVILGFTIATLGNPIVGLAGVGAAVFFAIWTTAVKYHKTGSVAQAVGCFAFEVIIGSLTSIIGFGLPLGVDWAAAMGEGLWSMQASTAIGDYICETLSEVLDYHPKQIHEISLINPFADATTESIATLEGLPADFNGMSDVLRNHRVLFQKLKESSKVATISAWDDAKQTMTCNLNVMTRETAKAVLPATRKVAEQDRSQPIT